MGSVDIIVPCYGYGHFLEECVRSALAQEGPAVRVLIIDDASPDETEAVGRRLAAADERVQYRRHVANQGHIATYNEGLAWADGDYLLLLSADDYLLPGALSRAVALMDARPEVGFIFGRGLLRYDDAPEPPIPAVDTSAETQVVDGRTFLDFTAFCNIVLTPTAVVRVALQREVGGYRPELPHTADLELWLRLAARASVGIVAAPQAVYRRHAANMSNAYRLNGRLPDLQHRKAALDRFCADHVALLPGVQELRRRVLHSMAREALSYATECHETGQSDMSRELAWFAMEAAPHIVGSPSWLVWRCQYVVGRRGAAVLKRAFATLRRLVRSRKRRAAPAWVRAAS